MINPQNSDQITRDFLDSLLLETRYIDADLPDISINLFGKTFSTPVMTAALSHLHKICPNAMSEFALGAKNADTLHWYGMGDDKELEDIISTGADVVKIIKPHESNDEVFRRINHAINSGAFAVGMDIDHAFNGNGEYDNVNGLPMKPKSLSEISDFVQAVKSNKNTPFIIKGVLSVSDAEKCAKAGVSGIVISHHHGIMDYSVPPLMVLPEIKKAVGNEMKVFIDCGMESSMDIFKALALGADAVSVGRNLMEPLKTGHEGVAKRLNELSNGLKSIMARTGCHKLSDIDNTIIHHRTF